MICNPRMSHAREHPSLQDFPNQNQNKGKLNPKFKYKTKKKKQKTKKQKHDKCKTIIQQDFITIMK